ncbi:hypothetical protein [Rhizobium bangladeshense]|uniref:hypothetical protein n=1 Tax=Rhizobium bangladeshense TaxID=1138189 RepID=UPI001C83352B|nr:hypothetical protein [Rhizobium bangladeshense]MBX4889824.1 hypothetical protein [Rhizobium bangladeshense]
MKSDIIERLRRYRPTDEWGDGVHHMICDEAASALTRAKAEVEWLQAILRDAEPYVELCHSLMAASDIRKRAWNVLKQVRAALESKGRSDES